MTEWPPIGKIAAHSACYMLKTLLGEDLSEPEFYGHLVYKFKKLIEERMIFLFSSEKSLHVTDV